MMKLLLFWVCFGWFPVIWASTFPSPDHSFTKSSQIILFAQLPDQRYGDVPFTLEATASSGLPVIFSVLSGPASLNGSLLTITGTGQVTVTASQAGTNDYYPAPDVKQSFHVNKANQSITFAELPNRTLLESPIQIKATANSGLPVELTIASGPATISGNSVILTGTGLITIRAYQAGNNQYNSAPYVNRSFMASKASQTISFNDLSDRVQGGDDFTLTATASSGLPVSYGIYYGPATLTGNRVRLTGFGKVRLNATQAGNFYYNNAAIDTFLCVVPVKPYITVDGAVLVSSSLVNNQWFYEGKAIPGANTLALTVMQNGRYSVQVANPDTDCSSSAMSDAVAIYLMDVEEETKEGWKIYPNPVRERLSVRLPETSTSQAIQVALYAPTGQVASSQQFSAGVKEININTGSLNSGLYLLEIRTGSQIIRRQVVIEH